MRPPRRLIRRTIVDPLWVPLGLGLSAAFLAIAAVAALVSPLTRRRRVLRLALFGSLYFALNVWLLLSCTALWVLHPRAARRDRDQWLQLHERALDRVLSVLVAAGRPLFGFTIEVQEPPDRDLIAGRPLLVLARHGGPGDSFALVHLLLSRYQRCPAIVLKETLRWDPGLDVILSRLPCCFLEPGDGPRMASRLGELARTMRPQDAILLFPEGGNWTPGRHRNAIARLRRAGRRQAAADAESNRNVLPPHPAGVLACLAGRPDLGVAVVAHTGLEALTSPALMWQAIPVTGRPMTVRWWYVPAAALPDTDGERREWLRLQWAIVDAWIDARKASRGERVLEPPAPEPLAPEPVRAAEPQRILPAPVLAEPGSVPTAPDGSITLAGDVTDTGPAEPLTGATEH